MATIEISDSAFEYLQSIATPFIDTPATALDKLIQAHQEFTRHPNSNAQHGQDSSFGLEFTQSNLPNVSFTDIKSAKIDGLPVAKKYWNNVLETVVEIALHKGATPKYLRDFLTWKTQEGAHDENGYRFIEAAGFSFQGLDAVRACKNIFLAAEEFGLDIEIVVRWQDNPKAQFAGQIGTLRHP